MSGEEVTEGVTEAELRVKTTEEEQGEEGLETSYESGRVEIESVGNPLVLS